MTSDDMTHQAITKAVLETQIVTSIGTLIAWIVIGMAVATTRMTEDVTIGMTADTKGMTTGATTGIITTAALTVSVTKGILAGAITVMGMIIGARMSTRSIEVENGSNKIPETAPVLTTGTGTTGTVAAMKGMMGVTPATAVILMKEVIHVMINTEIEIEEKTDTAIKTTSHKTTTTGTRIGVIGGKPHTIERNSTHLLVNKMLYNSKRVLGKQFSPLG